MEEEQKKKWGIYKLISGTEVVSNPIYTGPARKDLVLDVDVHNKVITRLLTRPKGDPVSPLPEKCDEIPWLKSTKSEKQWMDVKTLRVLQTFLIYSGYFMLVCKNNPLLFQIGHFRGHIELFHLISWPKFTTNSNTCMTNWWWCIHLECNGSETNFLTQLPIVPLDI